MDLYQNNNHNNYGDYIIPSKDAKIVEVDNTQDLDFQEYVVLQSNDTKPVQYQVSRNASKMSGLIKDMLDDQDEGQETIIPLPNVNGKTLAYVIQYLNHHYNNKMDKLRSLISKCKDDQEKIKLYEKLHSISLKRQNKINYYFDKIVKYLFDTYKNKKLIIVGYNLGWKQNLNLCNNKTNRKFYEIPYSRLLQKLKNKFNEKIITTEESYTSKCDSLSLESLEKKNNFIGNREKRGLFISKSGCKLNADLNGAINIMRKKIDLKEIKGLKLFNPVVVNIFREAKVLASE